MLRCEEIENTRLNLFIPTCISETYTMRSDIYDIFFEYKKPQVQYIRLNDIIFQSFITVE